MPSGRLAFFFTDIEGSTSRWERFPDAMKDALLLHDGIVREAIERNGGRVFKTVGDAFCAVFVDASAAVAAGVDVQRALSRETFTAVEGLAVRIAIHVGRAEERDDDYFGATVNRVARLLAVAHGGQIVLTGLAAEEAGAVPSPETTFWDLGEHRLRDLRVPERVSQIVAPGLPANFPALRSLSVYTSNLPLQLTELIGRRDEIATIFTMLDESRLVTITGTGGVGKTRVALQASAELIERYADGVWFVDLAPLPETTYVAGAFAASVGLVPPTDGRTVDALVAHLRTKRLLLVVDNCEHVIDEVATIVRAILTSCRDVTVLATSRERLHLGGEHVYGMPPLSVPPVDSVVELMQYDAYAFFMDRANAAVSTFAPTDRERAVIGEICRRLDGIPFAIELAAARSRVLSPNQIAERLDERLGFLSSNRRTVAPRQQTIRALIDWTHDSLDARERMLFARLAIFAGGWTLEAAEFVCADDTLPRDAIIDVLASLVEKSLVSPDVAGDDMRFTMLETTKAYALEKLVERGERERLARAHAEWVVAILEHRDPRSQKSLRRYSELASHENDNVRAALGWAISATGDRRVAARIAASAAGMWYDAGLQQEGVVWIESLLPNVDAESVAEPTIAAALWMGLARLTVAKRSIDAAERALELFERTGDESGVSSSLVRLAFAYWQAGSMDRARSLLDRALAMMRESGRTESIFYADALDALGSLYLNLGRLGEAQSHIEEAARLFTLSGEALGAARARGNLAELYFSRGDTDIALRYAEEAVATFRRLHSTTRECMAHVNAAAYRLARDDFDGAEREAHVALRMARRCGDGQLCAIALQNIACVQASRGNGEEAAVLLGFVDNWFESQGYEREWSEARTRERIQTMLESSLGTDWFDRARVLGTELSSAQVVERALRSDTR